MRYDPVRRKVLIAGLGIGAGFALSLALRSGYSAAASPAGSKVVRDSKDPRWVHATVIIAAPAERVLARVGQVSDWPKVLSDVRKLRVIEHRGGYWHVELETKTMDCGAHDYHINVAKDGSVKLVIDAPGINAHGLITAKQSGREDESVARFSLFIESAGIMGWFIPEKILRARQEQMVRRDLDDLARSFAKR